MSNAPQFPLYIVSKGRTEYMTTSRWLTKMGVAHLIVVEPQEVDLYRATVDKLGLLAEVLQLDLDYKTRYELCDDFGQSKSTGPGPARNFAWEHSIANGHQWHWVMDDNIYRFMRLNNNLRVPALSGAFWQAMEEFTLRYANVAMSGPNEIGFVRRKAKWAPFRVNTRIYSCNLIRNELPCRWRGRYNEDSILSLDLLKAGWCTILFNAMLMNKAPTQAQRGGNTAEFYHAEGKVEPGKKYTDTGTIAKSRMLAAVHPDVATVVFKFKRWHHHVDYTGFKHRKLVLREGFERPEGINNFGMRLRVRSLEVESP